MGARRTEPERLIAEVAVPLDLDQTFDYAVLPLMAGQMRPGQYVQVRLGKQLTEGFIVRLKRETTYPGELSPLLKILEPEPLFGEQELALARWLADRYLTPLGLVLQTITPVKHPQARRLGAKASRSYVRLAVELEEALHELERLRTRRASKQAALLRALIALEAPPLATELLRLADARPPALRALLQRGLVRLELEPRGRGVGFGEPKRYELTAEQEQAVAAIAEALEGHPKAFLLHGVNGSGKTEVYLEAAERALAAGKQVIIAVPEIALTPQLTARFRARFGDRVAVFHSGMTEAQRAAEWARMRAGEARLVIGVRAAIFAPFKNLGLIVVDEEHEPTYKQEQPAPRYHLREVALKRAELSGATVVLGSATPALESYYRAQQGEFELLELRQRVSGPGPAEIKLVDMRSERPGVLLSKPLRAALAERLRRGEQAILLLNRRGFSVALCRRCGEVVRCPSCGVPLVYHLRVQQLRCHYCGYVLKHPRCPRCGSRELLHLGAGTEQLELELRRLFPQARVQRMDSDVVRRGEHGPLLEAFRRKEVDVLLGTQMIGLGHDFPDVTLVGVVSVDTVLGLPDFRAAERAFQLVSQAAGRAGRGPRGGEVIIQTYYPEHYALQTAMEQDYLRFYRHELGFRRELGYPPFAELLQLTFSARGVAQAERQATRWAQFLVEEGDGSYEVLGPARAFPARLHGLYRWQLLLKGDGERIREAVKAALVEFGRAGVQLDPDPLV